MELFQLPGLGLDALAQFGGGDLEHPRRLEEQFLLLADQIQGASPHHRLDPPDAGGDGGFGEDAEQARLGRVVQMGAAAELHGELAHLHDPHRLAVLLAEDRHRAFGLRLFQRQDLRHHGEAGEDGVVDQGADLRQLLRRDRLEMGEVEAQTVRLHQGPGLMDVSAQDLLEGGVQEMRGGMGPADGGAALLIVRAGHGVADPEASPFQDARVQVLPALVPPHVRDAEHRLPGPDRAVVGHLSAHLRVQDGPVQHHGGLRSGGDLVLELVLHHDGQDLPRRLRVVVAVEDRGGHIAAELDPGPAQIALGLPVLLGRPALFLHHGVEAVPVQFYALLRRHLLRQVHGEAVGVVQPERLRPGEDRLPPLLMGGEQVVADLQPRVQGPGEVLLFCTDDLRDIRLFLPQVGIGALVLPDHGVHHVVQERPPDPQEASVTGGAAQETAQDVAPARVAGQDPVADHHDGGADVVRDDPQGHVGLVVLVIARPGELGDPVRDVAHGVHVEQGPHVLTDAGQAFQAHPRVDVLVLHLGVVALPVVDELGEDVVPHLDITVTVAADGARGASAAVFGAPVVVDLGAGTAGARAVLPEVVLLAEAEDPFRGDPDVLLPDPERLVVVQIDGGVQPVRFQPHHVGQELPAEGDGLLLEVVAEGEVAQHLEIRAVPVGLADVLDVAGTDALLTGRHPVPGGLLLPGEPGLHGGHAAVDEQQGRVPVGDEGETGQAQMAFALEVAEEHLPQFVQPVPGM